MILLLSSHEDVCAKFAGVLKNNDLDVSMISSLQEWASGLGLNPPSLLLVDVHQLDDGGLAILSEIQSNESLTHTCIVVLSSQCTLNQRIQCLQSGAIDCIPISIDPFEFVLKIHNLLAMSRRVKIALKREPTDKERILSAIKQNMKGTLNVESLSGELFMSRSSLQRSCIRYFQCGPKEVITRFRIQYAVSLVEFGANNVASLAYSVGYTNVNNFISAFKRLQDSTPKEFMKRRQLERATHLNNFTILVA